MSELIFNCRFVIDDESNRGSVQDRLDQIRKWLAGKAPVEASPGGLVYLANRLSGDLEGVSGHWEVQTEGEGS